MPAGGRAPGGDPAPGGYRSLKVRLGAGERLVGALVRMPAEDNVEMLALAGLDFVVVDCEHGPADVGDLRHHIALAQLHGMATLVRIGSGDNALALRVLDQGAEGVIAPHIDTADDAAALVRAVHYPPMGERGFATYPRAGGFGTVPAESHRQDALACTLVMVMLESPTATRNAAAILQTSGVDAFLVGTADLQASSGPNDPSVPSALGTIRRDAAVAGADRADLVGSVEAANEALADGADLVIYNVTHLLMTLFQELRIDTAPANDQQPENQQS